jgi:hypothetical protein
MSAPRRLILVLAALCAGFGLSSCASSTGQVELDPAYWFPDGKTKLPGERREVFPGGVPGVTQGIPPELVRGNPAAQQEQALAPVQETPPKPQAQENQKPRPKKVARPRPAPAPEPESQAQAARPAPQQQPPTGAWPASQPQQQPQASAPQAPAPQAWPAPPASGTFTR